MGGKSAKQKAQTGTCGYWPFASIFAQQSCCNGLAPFFNPGVFGAYGGCGYGGYGAGGISPLAFPFSGLFGFPGVGNCGSQTKGKANIKDLCTGATLKLKWWFFLLFI